MECNHIRASNGPQFTTCGLLTNHGMNHLPMVLKAGLVSLGVTLREINGEQKSEDESLSLRITLVMCMCTKTEGNVLSQLPLLCRIVSN